MILLGNKTLLGAWPCRARFGLNKNISDISHCRLVKIEKAPEDEVSKRKILILISLKMGVPKVFLRS